MVGLSEFRGSVPQSLRLRPFVNATLFQAPDPSANISQRLIPEEPLYIIMNLGISHAFGAVSPYELPGKTVAKGCESDLTPALVPCDNEHRLCSNISKSKPVQRT